uniref:Helicase n=1 Tax=Rhizophora mucronata TaxID=61149 RepID=A0A2P2MQR0_RHIMU
MSEVSQIPASEFSCNIYLKWSTGDEETIVSVVKSHCLGKERIFVLNSMGFINNYIAPAKASQGRLLFDGHFKACNTDIKFSCDQQLLTDMLPFIRIAKKLYCTQNWTKTTNLIHPVTKSRFWSNYHMRTSDSSKLVKVAQ